MLRVLQVSSDTNIGGAGKCILTYLKHRDRQRIETAVVLPKNSELKKMVEALGVQVFEIEAMADKSLDKKAISELVRVFREFKPDIVHAHASMSARIAARLCGVKVVYTRHSVFPQPKKLTQGLGKLASGLINNLTADKVIAVAEAAKENVVSIGVKAEKVEVILNGVEPLRRYDNAEMAALRERYNVPEGTKCAAIVARLNEVKGHKYFVEAAALLKEKGIKAKFFIAGTGEMEEAIKRQIVENGLDDYVVMLGFLDNVEPLMNLIDVQLNCSFGTEATSLSLLEGMSLGKPAVVSDFGGNPGVIENGVNGFVVPMKNAEAICEKLELIFADQELYEEMSRASIRVFEERFTAKKYAENIEKIYFGLRRKKNG